MIRPSQPRIEWISLLYLGLFVMAVLTPRIIGRDFFRFEEVQVEETMIFAFGLTGLLTFSLYGKLIERREKERAVAEAERDRAKQELSSSYAYIGAINRQMDALKRVANDTATTVLDHNGTQKKELLQSLAASAAAFVRASHATIRIVDLARCRTVREYHADANRPVQAHNKHLLVLQSETRSHGFVKGDAGEVFVIPSDRAGDATCKAFILIPLARAALSHEVDGGILKVYANQAELLHHAVPAPDETLALADPTALIRAAEERVVGEVS